MSSKSPKLKIALAVCVAAASFTVVVVWFGSGRSASTDARPGSGDGPAVGSGAGPGLSADEGLWSRPDLQAGLAMSESLVATFEERRGTQGPDSIVLSDPPEGWERMPDALVRRALAAEASLVVSFPAAVLGRPDARRLGSRYPGLVVTERPDGRLDYSGSIELDALMAIDLFPLIRSTISTPHMPGADSLQDLALVVDLGLQLAGGSIPRTIQESAPESVVGMLREAAEATWENERVETVVLASGVRQDPGSIFLSSGTLDWVLSDPELLGGAEVPESLLVPIFAEVPGVPVVSVTLGVAFESGMTGQVRVLAVLIPGIERWALASVQFRGPRSGVGAGGSYRETISVLSVCMSTPSWFITSGGFIPVAGE